MEKKTNALGIEDGVLEKVRNLLIEEGNTFAFLLDDRQLAEISAAAMGTAREAVVAEAERKAAEIAVGIVEREAEGIAERLIGTIESCVASDSASLKSALMTGQGTFADRVTEAVIAKISPRLFGGRKVDDLPPCMPGHIRVRIPEGITPVQVYDMMPDGFMKEIKADNPSGVVTRGSKQRSFKFERGGAEIPCGVIDFFKSGLEGNAQGLHAGPGLAQVYLAFVPEKMREFLLGVQINGTVYSRNVRRPSCENSFYYTDIVTLHGSSMSYCDTDSSSFLCYLPHFQSSP